MKKRQILPSFHLPLSMLYLFTYIFRFALVKEAHACLTACIQIKTEGVLVCHFSYSEPDLFGLPFKFSIDSYSLVIEVLQKCTKVPS